MMAARWMPISSTARAVRPPGAGALFGLWAFDGNNIYFVDDATNTFNLLH